MTRDRLVRAVLAACVSCGVMTADAPAATGDLVQKPGASGCLSLIGFCMPGRALDLAESVTVSPDGRNAYAASELSDAVTVFDRAADGTLTQKPGPAGCISDTGAGSCADGTALDAPVAVTVSPDGESVYVGSALSDAVAVFDRAANGRLTQKTGAAGCISDTGTGACADGTALNGARTVAVSPDGRRAYVAAPSSDAVAVFDRAPNGRLTQKPGTDGCVSDTGAGPCANGTALDAPDQVVVSPDGESVYVASALSSAVAVFDLGAEGTLAQKPGSAGCVSEDGAGRCVDGVGLDGAFSVTVSPDGRSVYVASVNDAVAMFDRRRNGKLVEKPGAAGCISETGAGPCIDGTGLDGASSVTVSADGQTAYVAASHSDAVTVFDRAPNGTLAQKPAQAGCVSESGAGQCVDGAGLDGAISVAVSPDGESVYVASLDSDALALFDREAIPPPPDTARPRLSALALSPARFRAGAGAELSFTLSEPAEVRIGVERAVGGARFRALPGAFALQGEAGQNRVRFSARLRARKLPPGRYRLSAGATDPAGNASRAKRARFAIVRR